MEFGDIISHSVSSSAYFIVLICPSRSTHETACILSLCRILPNPSPLKFEFRNGKETFQFVKLEDTAQWPFYLIFRIQSQKFGISVLLGCGMACKALGGYCPVSPAGAACHHSRWREEGCFLIPACTGLTCLRNRSGWGTASLCSCCGLGVTAGSPGSLAGQPPVN